MSDATEYHGSDGHPIRVGCFVRHDGESKMGGRIQFRGQVVKLGADKVGPILHIQEWINGAFTGKERFGRPQWAEVVRKPANLCELEEEAGRRDMRTEALALEQAREKAAARKRKGSSRRSALPKRKS